MSKAPEGPGEVENPDVAGRRGKHGVRQIDTVAICIVVPH